MTRTQTALYVWTAPDGTPRYLIDPAEWQDGQAWSGRAIRPTREMVRPSTNLGPIWVRDLRLVPVPPTVDGARWPDLTELREACEAYGDPTDKRSTTIKDGDVAEAACRLLDAVPSTGTDGGGES